MSGAIPPLAQYAYMAWCLVIAQGQLYLYLLYFEVRFMNFMSAAVILCET